MRGSEAALLLPRQGEMVALAEEEEEEGVGKRWENGADNDVDIQDTPERCNLCKNEPQA